MRDIRDWVIEESAKLGYDFNSLPQNKQNMILSSIMAGLENGFRSRCNYPDLRFARRRGIDRSRNSKTSSSQAKGTNQPAHYTDVMPPLDEPPGSCLDACDPPPPIDPCDSNGCNGGDACDSNGCGGGGETDTDCSENDGFTCDNGCVNEYETACTDDDKCIDNECENSGINMETCSDETTGSAGCIDTRCTNTATGGCNDTATGGACSDQKCINDYCSDTINCGSMNDPDDESTKCGDQQCVNMESCIDGGTGDVTCVDTACQNTSGTKGASNACIDTSCGDVMCINTWGKCGDTEVGSNSCHDSPCLNQDCYNQDSSSGCIDNSCRNQPFCTDSPNTTCTDACGSIVDRRDTNKCVDDNFCIDDECGNDIEKPSMSCLDNPGCRDNGCINERMCNDDASEGSCKDNSCVNEMICTDFGQCTDSSCDNEMCGDRAPTCSDSTCTNTTCSDGRGPASQSGCGSIDQDTTDDFCPDIQTATGCNDKGAVDTTADSCRIEMCSDQCGDVSIGIDCTDETNSCTDNGIYPAGGCLPT